MTHADLIDLGISSLDEFAAKVRRDAMGDAVKIIMSLTEPEAQDAEIERLRALLLSALPHVEVEGDDTLATIIHQELSQRREP